MLLRVRSKLKTYVGLHAFRFVETTSNRLPGDVKAYETSRNANASDSLARRHLPRLRRRAGSHKTLIPIQIH
jgi:hypothetical protein